MPGISTVIRYLIRKIVLFDDRADIYYNTPTDTTPGDGRGFCFYETQSAYVLYSAQGLLRGESKKMAISFRL